MELRHLTLEEMPIDTTSKADALLANPCFDGLHTLHLSENEVYPEAAEAIITHLGRLPMCRTFRLERSKAFGDVGAMALATSPTLPPLETLSLARTQMSDVGARALARCERLANLRELDLSECNIEESGALAIAESPHLKRLDRFLVDIIRTSRQDDTVTRTLIESGKTHGMTHIMTRRGPISSATFLAMLDSPEMAGACSLDLSRSAIDEASMTALSASPSMTGIHTLVLDRTPVTLEMAHTLARSPHLAHITSLSLRHTGIGDDALCAILESPHLTFLTCLDLRGNDLGQRAVHTIAECDALRTLDALYLDIRQIDEELHPLLAHARCLPFHIREHWLLWW